MTVFHGLRSTSSPAGVAFECDEGCGRLLVVDRRTGRLTILGRGDPAALHRGSTGDVEMSAPAVSPG
jgi:hypothetical protein